MANIDIKLDAKQIIESMADGMDLVADKVASIDSSNLEGLNPEQVISVIVEVIRESSKVVRGTEV